MIWSIEKASIWKRISAALFDIIIISIITVGFAFLISAIVDYDGASKEVKTYYDSYGETYNVDYSITSSEYEKLDEAEKERYQEALKSLNSDQGFLKAYNYAISLTFLIVSLSLFFGTLIPEFILPLIFKNGQTLGKKCFGICLVKPNSVRVTPFQMFARSILGKYVIEIMVPVLIILMIYHGTLGIVGTIVLLILAIMQIVLLFATGNKTVIHDILACTVVVDKSSQMIFSDEEELIEYKKQYSLEKANTQKYF